MPCQLIIAEAAPQNFTEFDTRIALLGINIYTMDPAALQDMHTLQGRPD